MEVGMPGRTLIRTQLLKAKRKIPGGLNEAGTHFSKFSTYTMHFLKITCIPCAPSIHEATPNSLSLLP